MDWSSYTQELWENYEELNTERQTSYNSVQKSLLFRWGRRLITCQSTNLWPLACLSRKRREGAYAHNNPEAPTHEIQLKAQEDRQAKLPLREAAYLAGTTQT